jgi:hypothetical protein
MAVRAHAERLLRGRMHRILACFADRAQIAGTIHREPIWLVRVTSGLVGGPAGHPPLRRRAQDGPCSDKRAEAVADTPQINFDASAVLRKWPSLNNARIGSATPYLVATLDECIRQFTLKPMS